MTKITIPQAKNTIKRCLSEIISKSPTENEKKEIWNYFESKCAYCGTHIKSGNGHLDHLIPFDNQGSNGKYNRVLSCPKCNSKEKLDMDWEIFLAQKCSGSIFESRKAKILNWKKNDTEIISENTLKEFYSTLENIYSNLNANIESLKLFLEK